MTDLLALAARVEAEPPSWELADKVLLACGWRLKWAIENLSLEQRNKAYWFPPGKTKAIDIVEGSKRPNPLASLDTALELVPEGWDYVLAHGHKGNGDLVTVASLGNPNDLDQGPIDVNCNNLAQALTAACLRARVAMEEKT